LARQMHCRTVHAKLSLSNEMHVHKRSKAWPAEKFMAITIVWRNPLPPPRTEGRVEQLVLDEFGALYVATLRDLRVPFELILGGAAQTVGRETA